MTKFLFIVGVGRSGTSLLQSMFAANGFLYYLPETAFVRRYVINGLLLKLYLKGGRALVRSQLEGDTLFRRTGIDVDRLLEAEELDQSFSGVGLYLTLSRIASDGDVEWVGDKDPKLIEFLPILADLASDVCIVHVIRDPRDVLLSKKRAAWSKAGHVWKHIFASRVQLKLGVFNGPKTSGLRYYEVVYEELISDPERVLKELCDNIGLPFDPAMLEFGDAAKKLVSKEEVSWKKETFGPLLSDNKEKWRDGLSAREIRLTELCCRQAFRMGNYQYDTRARKLSLVDHIWVLSGACAIYLMDWPYRLYRTIKVKRACKRMT